MRYSQQSTLNPCESQTSNTTCEYRTHVGDLVAGRGRVPKDPHQRRNTSEAPIRGDWQATPGIGWQHGEIPPPPDGLLAPSRVAWETWMRAWFAAHWTPDDLPGLRKVVQLYDATERGELHRSAELRMSMDNYGITPKGQQRMSMDEVGLYTVKDGKIVEERFFF